ncbi:patatin family protein [Fusibacter paucivorans]|uniref:Patatin family protein n=1 Tax=Fusibacter paucivorans TaxID=76009 RepID=A0ABS5PM96_9FIRM|nr:patatin family protein [Fusibacter paucivorans]MBS7526300.1 patatin family protein [Fusibacter paucivorans]
MRSDVGLVLEGGGMRGLYTCGVLDGLLAQQMMFPYVIGVSAGACNAVSYIAKQKGRNFIVNTAYVNDWRYMSLRNLLREKSYFGMHFIFDEIPNQHVSFDYQAFEAADCRFIVGTTDCQTGMPVYFEKEDFKQGFDILKASSSLPMIAPMVDVQGKMLLDGGVSDPIPLEKSIRDGNQKHVVVLTRDAAYRKKPQAFRNLIKAKYRHYPKLVDAMMQRHERYNQTLALIERMSAEGTVYVIRPEELVKVDRLEKDVEKLKALYQQGENDFNRHLTALKDFIK